jgi:hypothetical protein
VTPLPFQVARPPRFVLLRIILGHGFSTVRCSGHVRDITNHSRIGHIEWHLESGLAVQFIEAPLQAQERAVGQFPSFLNEQCAALGVPQSGNAAGHASATDLSGLPLGPWPQIMGWQPKGILAMTG